jgi:hypothetical protein
MARLRCGSRGAERYGALRTGRLALAEVFREVLLLGEENAP